MIDYVERNQKIRELFLGGVTQVDIAEKYGITKQRVSQLLIKMGITAVDGGVHVRASIERLAVAEELKKIDAPDVRIKDIAKKMGLYPSRVGVIMKEHGIKKIGYEHNGERYCSYCNGVFPSSEFYSYNLKCGRTQYRHRRCNFDKMKKWQEKIMNSKPEVDGEWLRYKDFMAKYSLPSARLLYLALNGIIKVRVTSKGKLYSCSSYEEAVKNGKYKPRG